MEVTEREERMLKKRLVNPYFWIGVVSVLILAIGLDPAQLTSWDILWAEIKEFFGSPFLIGTAIVALVSTYIDPSTGGLKDGDPIYIKEEEHE